MVITLVVLLIMVRSGGGGGYSQGTVGSGTAGQGNDGGAVGQLCGSATVVLAQSVLLVILFLTEVVTVVMGVSLVIGQLQHLLVTMVIMSAVAVAVAPTMVEHTMVGQWWTRRQCRFKL